MNKITIAGKDEVISNILKDISDSLPCCNDVLEKSLKDKICCELNKLKPKRIRPTRAKNVVRKKNVAAIKAAVDKVKNNFRFSGYSDRKIIECFIFAFEKLAQKPTDNYIDFMIGKSRDKRSRETSLVFQEFLKIAENALPFEHRMQNPATGDYTKKEIYSLEETKMFRCRTKFKAIVNNKTIPNNTKERYVSPYGKDYGPCFIGKLISVKRKGRNVMKKVTGYGFNEININLPDGTEVEVEHMAIDSHWDIGMLNVMHRVKNAICENL